MGTSGSYGGSQKQKWKDARQQVLDLPGGGGGESSGDSIPDLDGALDELWGTIADALDSDDPSLHAPQLDEPSIGIQNILPWLSVTQPSGRGEGGGGGGGGGQRTGAGRQGSRSPRQVTRSAARGGTALGAAHAVRQGDATYLNELGLDLDRLRSLSAPRQCGEILDAVLGEGGHPDEAALRKASLESLKTILTSDQEPDGLTSVQTFVTNFVFELALVELQSQVNTGAITKADVAKQEEIVKSYLDRRVHSAFTAGSGPLKPRDLRTQAARLSKEVVQILRARDGANLES